MVSLASPGGAMPPPATTPLKRPTLSMKRDSSFLDTDDESGLSTSTKKLRVTFDPRVDVRTIDDSIDKSYDLVKEEVQQGIERHIAPGDKRDDTQYTKLLELLGQDVFSSDAPSPKLLKKYVLAIDSRVSYLGQCRKLAMAMLDLAWLGRDATFVELYIRFLCDLASAHGKYVAAIMESLVPNLAKLPTSCGRLPEETPVAKAHMHNRVFIAIRALTRSVPSAISALMQTLRYSFPNDSESTRSYVQYQKHLLRLAEQMPELKGEILALIVQKVVGMDVQIQADVEDLEDEEEERLLQRPSSKDGDGEDSDDSDIDSISESELTMTDEELRLRDFRLKVAKMDGTLDMLFEYYDKAINDPDKLVSDTAYFHILSHFETSILPNRSRHAQFLQFHFAQTSRARIEEFVQKCLRLSMLESGSSIQRLTACAYLASFIARGAHIPTSSVREVFGVMLTCLDNMRRKYEPECKGPNRRMYALYYALAQAIIYIFCFRWRNLVLGPASPDPSDSDDFDPDDALAEDRELSWDPQMKEIIRANIYSKLNPMKVASQDIVSEFAKIAHHLKIFYIFPLLETNKRVRLGQVFSYYNTGGALDFGRRETAWDRKTGDAHHQLEAYFPFDPYHLPKSKRWVKGEYNEWKLPRGLRDKDDDAVADVDGDSESDEEKEEEEEEEEEDYDSDEDSVAEEEAVPSASG